MAICKVRIEFKCASDLSFRRRPIPIEKKFVGCHRRVRFSQCIVERDSPSCRPFCFWCGFLRRNDPKRSLYIVGFRQSDVGERIVRVYINCLLEILDGLLRPIFCKFVPEVRALHIKLKGFDVFRVVLRQLLLVRA